MPKIYYERQGYTVLITLEGGNDLNLGTVDEELYGRLVEYRDDQDLRCAVVTGAGDKAFCVGADLKAGFQRGPRTSGWRGP